MSVLSPRSVSDLLERAIEPKIIALARKYDIKIIATNDAHFVNEEDAEAHDRSVMRLRYSSSVPKSAGMANVGIMAEWSMSYSSTLSAISRVFVPRANHETYELQRAIEPKIIALARKYDIKIIATNDSCSLSVRGWW